MRSEVGAEGSRVDGVQRISMRERLKGPRWCSGCGGGDKMKMCFHLPRQTGPDTAGRVTGILIGAAGLKEFVPGTSFSSISFEDLAALEATLSSSTYLASPSPLFFFVLDPASVFPLEGLGSWKRLVSQCSHWARHFSQVPQELSLVSVKSHSDRTDARDKAGLKGSRKSHQPKQKAEQLAFSRNLPLDDSILCSPCLGS